MPCWVLLSELWSYLVLSLVQSVIQKGNLTGNLTKKIVVYDFHVMLLHCFRRIQVRIVPFFYNLIYVDSLLVFFSILLTVIFKVL